MAKPRCFIGVQRVVHAHFHFGEGACEIEINWRIVNGVAAQYDQQLDIAGLHITDELA